jgi:hypothetical protein
MGNCHDKEPTSGATYCLSQCTLPHSPERLCRSISWPQLITHDTFGVKEDNQHHLRFRAQHSCHFSSVRWAHWPPGASSFRFGVILGYSWLITSDDTVNNVQFFPIHSTRSVKVLFHFLVMHQNYGNHLHVHISHVQYNSSSYSCQMIHYSFLAPQHHSHHQMVITAYQILNSLGICISFVFWDQRNFGSLCTSSHLSKNLEQHSVRWIRHSWSPHTSVNIPLVLDAILLYLAKIWC